MGIIYKFKNWMFFCAFKYIYSIYNCSDKTYLFINMFWSIHSSALIFFEKKIQSLVC